MLEQFQMVAEEVMPHFRGSGGARRRREVPEGSSRAADVSREAGIHRRRGENDERSREPFCVSLPCCARSCGGAVPYRIAVSRV